jgi:hypothetical protein
MTEMIFYVGRTVHFGMKLYNDQRNAHVFNCLSIYFCPTRFGLSFSPSSGAGVQFRQWLGAGTITGDLNYCRNYTPASDDGLKESPKHVRQK